MIEIRTIRPPEGEAFLRLLCEVFKLDYYRAYDVFFTEPMFDIDRKWALFEGGKMISILTTSPLAFGWGNAIGIAGVATRPERQGEGIASRLIQKVLRESERRDEGPALLFARDTGLYVANGFEPIDRVIRAPILVEGDEEIEALETEVVESFYNRWASEHPDRLRRDVRRWAYWRWHFRMATPYQDGYLCTEPGVLREALYTQAVATLPLPENTDFLGTTFMADQLNLPLGVPTVDLYLMGRNVPGIPQMFMTDQF